MVQSFTKFDGEPIRPPRLSPLKRLRKGGQGETPTPPPPHTPSLDFSDTRNTQYLYLLLEEWVM